MSSPMTIKLKAEPYIIQFCTAIYGPMPLQFKKGDKFSNLLQHLLDKPPRDYPVTSDTFDENTLIIALPYFESKNVLYNFHLNKSGEKLLLKALYLHFKVLFRIDIDKSKYYGFSTKDSIINFMEKYDISPQYTDMLIKDYQRVMHNRRQAKFQANKSKKKSSVE